MEQYKRAKVIMLPTEDNHSKFAKYILDSSFGGCIKENELCTTTSTIGWSNIFKPQHLYIISDDKIKKGDWYINLKYNKIIHKKDALPLKDNCKKIIATTDTSLKYFIDGNGNKSSHELTKSGYIEFLPQPSQQFIEKYIESYNKGEVITDVLVEYEDYDWDLLTSGNTTIHQRVKVNPKDNTITIKKLKDSWNREELKVLFKKHEKDVIKYINGSGASATPSFNDKWIKENL